MDDAMRNHDGQGGEGHGARLDAMKERGILDGAAGERIARDEPAYREGHRIGSWHRGKAEPHRAELPACASFSS